MTTFIATVPQKLFLNVPRIKRRTFIVLSFLLTFSLLVFYVYQVNEMTRLGSLLSKYESGLSRLSQDNKALESAFSQSNSLGSLEGMLKGGSYEKVGKIFYIRLLNGTAMNE